MGYKVTLDVGRRYTGCKELIPGSVYLDDKGNKILFVGFGRFRIGELSTMELSDIFIYMKVDQIEKKIDRGILEKDLSNYYGEDMRAYALFYTSQKPRLLKSFAYEMFPSDYFENFLITQHFDDGFDMDIHIQTEPIISRYACKVEKI